MSLETQGRVCEWERLSTRKATHVSNNCWCCRLLWVIKKKKSKCSCNVTSVVCVCHLTEYFGRWLGAKRLLLQVIIIPVSLIEPNQQLSSEDDNYSSCVCLSLLSIGLRKCTLLYFFSLCSRGGCGCNTALSIWVSLHSDTRRNLDVWRTAACTLNSEHKWYVWI